MKLLIIQAHGEHKENEAFREALNFCRAFHRLREQGEAIDPIVCGSGYYNQKNLKSRIEWADVIFCVENYERGNWIPSMLTNKALRVFWTIDSHVRFQPHLHFARKHCFDLVLSSTAEIVPQWRAEGFKCEWFPNAYPSDLVGLRSRKRKYDVGFCGLFPGNRKKFYDEVAAQVPMHLDTFVIGESMVQAINEYKIHLNRNVRNDVNYRTFETLGCGTFLLTNDTDKLGKLFEIGKHLDVYDGVDECIEKIKYYLEYSDKRETMAMDGYEYVRKYHTYDVRARQFLELVKERI